MLGWLSLPAGEGRQPTVLAWMGVRRTEQQRKQGRGGNNIHGAVISPHSVKVNSSRWVMASDQEKALSDMALEETHWEGDRVGGELPGREGSCQLDNNLTCNFPLFFDSFHLPGSLKPLWQRLVQHANQLSVESVILPLLSVYGFAGQIFFPLKSSDFFFFSSSDFSHLSTWANPKKGVLFCFAFLHFYKDTWGLSHLDWEWTFDFCKWA